MSPNNNFTFHHSLTFILLFYSVLLSAQDTGGSVAGYVKEANGTSVEFATVKLVDVYTNAISGTSSQANGFYSVQNLTPSTYRLEVSYVGFKTFEKQLLVRLGAETKIDAVLEPLASDLGEVVVEARARGGSLGNEASITGKRIEETPTIFRSVQELTRTLSENNLNSFGGASHRFNNLNIDGVATNDVIGFQEPASGAAGSQANGTPGSLAKTQAIGFGAIKQLSVKLVPFDGSIGNFNGANIDVVTKNGTNLPERSVFFYGNNQVTQGSYAAGEQQVESEYSDYQVGASLGGAIKKNKLFYFTNIEFAKTNIPLTAVPGTNQSNIESADIAAVRNHLIEEYDYDPGAFQSGNVGTQSFKLFTRLDWNINEKHKLTLRNNYVNSYADNLEWNANFFNFGNQGFRHQSRANSTVLELKSSGDRFFNKLNIGFNQVKEGRSSEGRIFPHIQIASSSSSRIFAGTYREASVFNTLFNSFQISNKFSYILGSHSLSAGLQAQLHDVDYGFLSAWNGRWEYKSVEDFLNDRPARVRGVYNVSPQNNNYAYVQANPAATLGIMESALYVQDKWNVNQNLNVTLALRLDAQFLTEKLPLSTLISSSPDFNRFDNQYRNNYQINPRLGFKYTFENQALSLSGGTGLFSGRLPYLWFAYMEYISGTSYFNVDIRPQDALPLTEDLGDLIALQPSITEVNLLGENFRYPREWKTNFRLDYQASPAWKFALEWTHTDVLYGLLFQTANRKEVLARYDGADDRLFYDTRGGDSKISSDFTNVFVLTNTEDGYRYNLSAQAEYNTKRSYTSLRYSYGRSMDISSTVRSSPAANYEWNQALLGNNPDLSFSNYDLRHKFIAVQSFRHRFKKNTFLASLLYNGRSGSPFSFVYQGDLNNDGSSRNDLVYIPRDASEIDFVDFVDANGALVTATTQWTRLNQYIEDNDYLKENRGGYAQRNGPRTPWNHELDMKLEWERNIFKNKKLTISADIFNVLNLLNKDWGALVYVPNVVNSSYSLLKLEGIENNRPYYTFNVAEGQNPWVLDNFNSRWRIQLGAKLDF